MMTLVFSNEEIALARRLKLAGLPWEPRVGHCACEAGAAGNAGDGARIRLLDDLDRRAAEFGGVQGLRASLTWLPDWRDARIMLRELGARDDEVLGRLGADGYFATGRELVGIYVMLLERLEAPPSPAPGKRGGAARRAARLGQVPRETPLTEAQAGADPFDLFSRWFREALDTPHIEPTAMALATVTPRGGPSVRMVLLKGCDERGFVFFTNRASSKARELTACPAAALAIWWDVLERQVRVEGPVQPTSDAEADAYFASRPTGSQLGAWASPQSEVIPDRATLEAAVANVTARFAGAPVPRPTFWGGYRLVPEAIEFWQGRRDRLHDRLLYTRTPGGVWSRTRLAP